MMANDHSRHEALDRAALVADIVARFLMEHDHIKKNPAYLSHAETAHLIIHKLYQAIGEDHLKENE